jgi:Co/Zn/Cd efflux system component
VWSYDSGRISGAYVAAGACLSIAAIALYAMRATEYAARMVNVVAILSMIGGGLGYLFLLGLCVAGVPNSTERQMREIHLWMLAIAVVGILVTAVCVTLFRTNHPWWCTGVALLTPIVLFSVMLWATTP